MEPYLLSANQPLRKQGLKLRTPHGFHKNHTLPVQPAYVLNIGGGQPAILESLFVSAKMEGQLLRPLGDTPAGATQQDFTVQRYTARVYAPSGNATVQQLVPTLLYERSLRLNLTLRAPAGKIYYAGTLQINEATGRSQYRCQLVQLPAAEQDDAQIRELVRSQAGYGNATGWPIVYAGTEDLARCPGG